MKPKFFFFGSFDPFTRFDFNVVLSLMSNGGFSEGFIAIDVDYSKQNIFSLRAREEMIEATLKWYDNLYKTDYYSRVKVVSFSGVPVYKAMQLEATTLVTMENHNKAVVSSAIARSMFDYSLNIDDISFMFENEFATDNSDVSDTVRFLYLNREYIMLQRYLTPAVHNMVMAMALKDEYLECCRGSYISWDDFVSVVGSRSYHNLSHIAYMLNRYRFYQKKVFSPEQHFQNLNFKAAIFFHDYVANNEVKSFEYSRLSDKSKGLFLATKHGAGASENLSDTEQLISYLDLAILADDFLYNDYKAGIRMEYADVSYEDYAIGRIKVLDELTKEVENSKRFGESEKKRACKNLATEKKELQKQLFKIKLRKFFSRKK